MSNKRIQIDGFDTRLLDLSINQVFNLIEDGHLSEDDFEEWIDNLKEEWAGTIFTNRTIQW